jgi:sugar phosphate isomerase/epimerase
MARVNALSFHEHAGIEAICRQVLDAGFDSLELCRPRFYEKLTTPSTRRRFADWAQRQGLNLYGFDCWVDVDPYTRREETLAEFRRAIDWAADLNLAMVISHDPWQAVNAGRSPSACLGTCIELFHHVGEACAKRGLHLVLEPHPDTLSMDNAWAIELIDSASEGLPAGVLGILYDSCHYGVGQPDNYIAAIHTLGQRIRHVHFADGDRETYALHLALGEGTLDLDGIASALKATGGKMSLTNDLYNCPLPQEAGRHNSPRIRAVERELNIRGADLQVCRS